MEKGHSEVWNKISHDEGFKDFKVTFGLRLHIFILKLISIFIPLPIMVNYLEYQEKRAIFNYSVLLEIDSDNKLQLFTLCYSDEKLIKLSEFFFNWKFHLLS